jgi:asparagine synthase (glutamine-hydrolysing)
MSGICGWTNNQLNLESSSLILDKMVSELSINPKHSTKWDISLDFGLAAVGLRQNSDVETDSNSIMVAIQGDVYWLDDELKEASVKHGLAHTVQQAFLKNGIQFLGKLSGSFSLCIIDVVHRKTFIAIDKLGISSLFFTVVNNQLIFGSNARAILKYPHTDSTINPQGIYDYLYFHMVPSPRCIFNKIEKLLPGEYVLFENNQTIRNFYWRATYKEIQNINLKKLEQEFLEILESSVRRAAHDTKTGAFLSGGTDSSTISGMLRKIKNYPVDTYSIGFDAEGFDETKYARIASRHFDTKPHEYYLTPQDVVDAIPLIAKAYDEPFGNASAVPAYYCAKHANADGLHTLLAGDGGDEIFGGNERYVKQKVFEFYNHIPAVLRRFLIEPAAFNFPLAEKIGPITKAQNYINQAKVPLPDRMETYNLLNRIPLENIFDNDFLASININEPAAFLRHTYNSVHAESTLNKMLSLDLKFTLADNDLRKVNRMCELGQMEVRYPFLDEEFIKFSSQLPVFLKIHGFKLRYFFKHSLKGFLPDEILNKKKQGFGLPFGVWMNTYQPLGDLANESNLALSKRGIIKPEFIDEIQRLHKQYPGYYGVMIWVLMMLEQWLQSTI